jgi:Tol biopolymer transport system component
MRIRIIIVAALLLLIGCEDNYYDDDSYYSYNESLYVVNTDGTDLRQVTMDANRFWNLVFLPDGSGLVFSAMGNISGRFCYDLASGEIVPYEEPTAQDSLWIYEPHDGEIYLVNSIESDTTNITNDEDRNYDPVLTADKTKVIFITLSFDHEEMLNEYKIEVLEVSSLERYEIAVFDDYINLLTCSDDLSLLVYYVSEGLFNQLWLLRTESLSFTKICDTFSTYSADIDDARANIVFEAYSGDNKEIFLVDFATRTKTKLTDSPGYDTGPLFSPDGMKVLYGYWYQDQSSLMIVNRDGSNVRELASEKSYVYDYCLSPDGKRVAFICTD